ncbi:hypothetical protein [Nocardioides mesophilus]|uniref:HTH cro/C1-type domain-containing protein n=1 Tax=Nocardioides mesophilus TaxID=433659 RepID=A0A7G9REC0_9ACTN|nr:hypothetical protein [Nocardioides mesophilus]QNN53945.1 hypothetical protein H9L09_06060 [Nocardioides mesophilus]
MTAKRPGRVQRIAYDETPINAAAVDVEARIGWLLAMSRLHHEDPAFGDGRVFAAALADAGMPASRSVLSRWESGEIPISYEAMAAYERVLGLEVGRISSITSYVGSILPGVKTRLVRPRLDPASPEFSTRLDELIDLAEDGRALARDWQDLGWHLAAAPLVHLRAETWRKLCTRLVWLVPRSVKLAYRQYSTAAFNIALLPRAQPFLVDAIAAYVADADVQVITSPVGLLDRLPTREASRLVLDIVEDPSNELAFSTGVWLATQKLARGHFTPEERDRLDMIVLTLWRRNPAKAGEDLLELIAEMPEGVRSTLVHAATRAGRRKLGYAVEHGEEIVATRARSFAQQVADHARRRVPQEAAYHEDRMLTRLVREALFHRDSERRHLAALLIASSPFGQAVTDCLLMVLGDREQQSPWMRMRMATLARYLSDGSHRLRILSLMDDPDEAVRSPLIQGIGHMPLSATSDQVLRSSLGQEWSLGERAKMYALGMSGSPALPMIAASESAPPWQRSAARWWHAQGPALRA